MGRLYRGPSTDGKSLVVLQVNNRGVDNKAAELRNLVYKHNPYVVILLFVSFYVLFVCKCVLLYCHRVTTQLQLTNISYSNI